MGIDATRAAGYLVMAVEGITTSEQYCRSSLFVYFGPALKIHPRTGEDRHIVSLTCRNLVLACGACLWYKLASCASSCSCLLFFH